MNILFRVLLTIYGFCLAVLSFIAASIAVNTAIFNRIAIFMFESVLPSGRARVILFIIAMVFFVLSITFLLSGIRNNKDKKSVSKYTNIGEIKISLDSIESIALAASKKLNGIKETKAYVSKIDGGVSINLRTIIFGDVNIPKLSEDIQVKVKNSVEDATGINVNDVKVIVENIHTGYAVSKSRVE